MIDRLASAYAVAADAGWVSAIRFANLLLRRGHRVLLATGSLAEPANGSGVAPGSIVVPLSAEFDPGLDRAVSADEVRAVAAEVGVSLVPLDGTDSLVAATLMPARVGLYGGGGAPFNHAAILAACGFPLRFVSDAEVRAGAVAEVDVFVVPGGGSRAMHGQLEPLGEDGCRAIAEFVRDGGMYIGCCAGSYDCIVNSDAFVQSCPAQRHLQLLSAVPWRADGAVEFLDLQSPGVGVVTVNNTRPDHPVMYGMPDQFAIVHYNGPILDPLPERAVAGASAAEGLARFAGWTDRFTPAEAFAGPPNDDRPTYLARAIDAGRFAIAAGEYGTGRVVAFGSHPEFGFDLPMVEWTNPARMLANAVLWQAGSARQPASAAPPAASGRRVGLPLGATLAAVTPAAAALTERARDLQQRPLEPRPRWLSPEYALSVFRLAPEEVWRQSLVDLQTLAAGAAELADGIRDRILVLIAEHGEGLPAPIRAAILMTENWLLDERAPGWEQDGGFRGVLPLLRTATAMCETAAANWEIELGPPAGPYGYLDTNPYHLVAGSYLAAIGCAGGAVQLLRALDAELTMAEQVVRAAARRDRPVEALAAR